MANENEMNELKKKGIFINQLPPEYLEEACSRFPLSIHYALCEDKGLYIFFNDESQALTHARSRSIMINGQHFQISLAVTKLTVHGVSAFLTDHELRNLMELNKYEDIISIDAVEGRAEHEVFVTYRMNGDYRVILDTPEILCFYPLLPMLWPHGDVTFKITFFCQFCHQDGHKSCECPELSRVVPFIGKNEKTNECIPADGKEMNLGQFHVQSGGTINFNIKKFSVNRKSAKPYFSHTSDVKKSSAMMPKSHLNMTKNTGRRLESEISNPLETVKLSKGTIQAVRNVVSNPDSMIIFLNHVRGRKNNALKEIALAHAKYSPVSDLIKQLELVVQNYYTSVIIRGPSEDSDMKYIKNLIERLRKLFPPTTGSSSSQVPLS